MTDDSILRVAADEAAQLAWGATLGRLLCGENGLAHPGGGLVFLEGQLGAGKTTLVRGLLRGLGHHGPVRSPTYTLVESFELPAAHVHHLDLYRLADPEELEYLGIRDLLDGASLVLVEWPERGVGVLPAPELRVHIAAHGAGRRLMLVPGVAWRQALATRLPASPSEMAAG
jgi:tRNA threonylcarbamoyladenosine biosynthesis protein TsaE